MLTFQQCIPFGPFCFDAKKPTATLNKTKHTCWPSLSSVFHYDSYKVCPAAYLFSNLLHVESFCFFCCFVLCRVFYVCMFNWMHVILSGLAEQTDFHSFIHSEWLLYSFKAVHVAKTKEMTGFRRIMMTPQSQCALEKNSDTLEGYKWGVSVYNKPNWEANMHAGTKTGMSSP